MKIYLSVNISYGCIHHRFEHIDASSKAELLKQIKSLMIPATCPKCEANIARFKTGKLSPAQNRLIAELQKSGNDWTSPEVAFSTITALSGVLESQRSFGYSSVYRIKPELIRETR